MLRYLLVPLAALTLAAQAPKPTKTLMDLQILFQQNCVKCHGPDGSGTGPEGKRLKGRDFTSEKEMRGTTDAGLARTIRRGIFFGKVMPAFKDQLSEEEALRMVRDVVRKAEKGRVIAPKVDTD